MSRKTIVSIASFCLLYVALQLLNSPVTYASMRVTTPSFPSCANPQGTSLVYYSTGIHGIPGDTKTYSGSDAVYTLSADTLTQCFCAEDGTGIQTNWWKATSLNFEEIEYLQNLKWIYIPNGAEWGLQEAPYMAINNNFSCKENKKEEKDHDHHHHDNDNDDDDEEENEGGIGSVLGASTLGEVLGLASTGNADKIALTVSGALLTAGAGLYLLKKANAKK